MLLWPLNDWLGVARKETWYYSTWIHHVETFKGKNVKQHLILKYNNTEPSQ